MHTHRHISVYISTSHPLALTGRAPSPTHQFRRARLSALGFVTRPPFRARSRAMPRRRTVFAPPLARGLFAPFCSRAFLRKLAPRRGSLAANGAPRRAGPLAVSQPLGFGAGQTQRTRGRASGIYAYICIYICVCVCVILLSVECATLLCDVLVAMPVHPNSALMPLYNTLHRKNEHNCCGQRASSS